MKKFVCDKTMFGLIWSVILIVSTSCVDPFSVDTDRTDRLMTVEGLISTGPGPYFVKLTTSDRYGGVFEGQIRPVNNATVAIRDNEGNVVFLNEKIQSTFTYFNSSFGVMRWVTEDVNRRLGIYETPAGFSAQVGKTYTLNITTAGGDVYTSIAETVTPVPPLDSISIRPYRRPSANPVADDSGINLFAHFKDPAASINFYMWRPLSADFPYITNPELFRERETGNIIPKDCCNICWRTDDELPKAFNVANDDSFNGLNTFQPILSIPDDGWRFKDKMRVRLSQYSLSSAGYRYLSLVKQQLQVNGSVFDPPPASIRGNMVKLDNPETIVLGFFFAVDESRYELYIRNSDLDYRQPAGVFNDDCREAKGFSYRLNVIPPADWDPR